MKISKPLDIDFTYCTELDHKQLRKHGFLSCCKCGGSTLPIDIDKWAEQLAEDVCKLND